MFRELDRGRPWDRVIVLANRAPYRHELRDGRIAARRSASGVVTALEPLLEIYGGTWVAHGAGAADRAVVDPHDGLDVPAGDARYRLRYVWLSQDEERGYYDGFANEGLWPLCHALQVAPIFRSRDFSMYHAANHRFACAVAEEAEGRTPLLLVQDYHFALAPAMLRRLVPGSTIASFWHIPWPAPRDFAACPWGRELLQGMLGSTVVGLQTSDDCENFLSCVERRLDATVDRQAGVIYQGHRTIQVRAYPVGIEWNGPVLQNTPPGNVCRARVLERLGLPVGSTLGLGVDRLDYTKGIHEKLLAIERFLELFPEYLGRFVFVQIAEPSRTGLPAYQAARQQIVGTCDRVNARFGTSSYRPILLREMHHDAAALNEFYRAADCCYVGSLKDGMNLVAKEFVAARADESGVLLLSQHAGAARQLAAALPIDPYDVECSALTLNRALTMPPGEQRRRMRALRAHVATCNTEWWAQQIIRDAGGPVRISTADRLPVTNRGRGYLTPAPAPVSAFSRASNPRWE